VDGARMAGMIVWPARRVGYRILCGRPVPNGGCRGEIAWATNEGGAVLPPGLKQDASGAWVATARAERKHADGRAIKSVLRSPRTPESIGRAAATEVPFRRKCPTCGFLAEVTADLLKS
jgi:hypothetical protein